MTYKIETKGTADGRRLEVHGLLDAAALDTIRQAIIAGPGKLRVVLKEGCQVEPAIVDELRGIPELELVAESPFLARWLGL